MELQALILYPPTAIIGLVSRLETADGSLCYERFIRELNKLVGVISDMELQSLILYPSMALLAWCRDSRLLMEVFATKGLSEG